MAWPRTTTSSWVKDSGSAGSDPDLLDHQVAPGNHLGDRMLDLDAGVHFQEIVAVSAVVEHELDRARPHVVDILREHEPRLRPSAAALRSVDYRGGRLLDQLLMAALR